MSTARKEAILEYVDAYNRCDVLGMLKHLHERIVFRNIVDGETTLVLETKEAFRKQAEVAQTFFSQRQQQVTGWQIAPNFIEISVTYEAILAADLPNGMKAGEKLKLQGKSRFEFDGHQIVLLEDIS